MSWQLAIPGTLAFIGIGHIAVAWFVAQDRNLKGGLNFPFLIVLYIFVSMGLFLASSGAVHVIAGDTATADLTPITQGVFIGLLAELLLTFFYIVYRLIFGSVEYVQDTAKMVMGGRR